MENHRSIWHLTNSGQHARPTVWRFEGKQVIALVVSVAAGIVAFRLLGGSEGIGLLPNTVLASSLPGGAVAIILRFFVGKPPSYFADWVEWQQQRDGKTPLISIKWKRRE